MTKAGIVLGTFSAFGLIGGIIGGALTDKFGRKSLIIFGLIFSTISTLALGLVNDFSVLIPLAVGIGLLSNFGGPARQAMIADLLPGARFSKAILPDGTKVPPGISFFRKLPCNSQLKISDVRNEIFFGYTIGKAIK